MLNSKLPYVDIISDRVTVSANSGKVAIFNLSPKDGYTLGGVTVVMSSGDVLDTQIVGLSSTSINIVVKSKYGAELTRTITVYVLYVPII